MPTTRRWFLGLLLACSAIAGTTRAAESERSPRMPRVTRVRIVKSARRLELWAGEEILRSYTAAMGPGGAGPKRREGDMVTPVGRYRILMHQPSRFRVFLRLDYPNAVDRARFAALVKSGELPRTARIGGDVGIHGPPVGLDEAEQRALTARDWTAGCIAVLDDEIREIARLVPDGTPVDIED